MFDRSIFTLVGRPASALVIASISLALASCGGSNGNGNPTTPTRQAAALNVTTFTASATQTGSEIRYELRATVRESGAQTGATLSTIELTFLDDSGPIATATFDDGWSTTRLAAGASLDSKRLTVTDSREGRRLATRVSARIPYVDDTQISSATTATANIAQPPAPPPQSAFTIAGVVSDDDEETPIAGATVTVVDGANAGRSSTTDGNGYYSIPALRTGSFTIRATKGGYNAADRGLTLSADTRLDLRMRSTAPPPAPPSPPPPPPGNGATCSGGSVPATVSCGKPTAQCKDGTYSCSQNRSGTCSHHQGVSCWVCPGPLCNPSVLEPAAEVVWTDAATAWR
jgi:carboxypeptidase family protein/uncharacterized protein DUF3761